MAATGHLLIEAFRHAGMKVTPQRHLLCSLIAEAHDHPTVETIYQRAVSQMPTMSLKTVYTTLTELAELGLIRLTELGTGSLRVDVDPQPHAHLVCRGCGRVFNQPLDERWDPPLAAQQAPGPAGEAFGFVIEEREVIYRGRCARCRTAPSVDERL